MRLLLILILFIHTSLLGQDTPQQNEGNTIIDRAFEKGTQEVNKCTPWHHMKCVYITTSEVYEDGRQGKSTRHWWRMSYIGQACTEQYGVVLGKVFEGIFALPHYVSMGIGNGAGYLVYLAGRSKDRTRVRTRSKKEEG